MRNCSTLIRSVLLVLLGVLFVSGVAFAQKRDHLTEPEMELIRNSQELDKRIDVFIKAADRRLAIITGTVPAAPPKKTKKDEELWGDMPQGSRAELLSDIAGILDEAITNIDDVNRRDEKNPLISRSLRKLAAASNGYVAKLTALRDQTKVEAELAAIEHALDNASQIIEVGNKLPAPPPPGKKKDKP
jgi:hypothetical protein